MPLTIIIFPKCSYALVDQNGGTHLWPLKVLYSSSLKSFKLFKLSVMFLYQHWLERNVNGWYFYLIQTISFGLWFVLQNKKFSKLSGCLFYFGGARSKGFATLRNVSKLQFFDKIGQAKSVGFRLYSAI